VARNATIYRAVLELSHVDRDVYGDLKLTLARHPSETIERTLVRLLAYGIRYDEALSFGRGVSTVDEPDLWSLSPDGRIQQWVEVGQPDAKRLVRAARRADSVTLLAFGEGVERWRAAQLAAADLPSNLGVCRIDDAFIAALAREANRSIEWSLTISDGVIFLVDRGLSFETTPEIWLGDPLG